MVLQLALDEYKDQIHLEDVFQANADSEVAKPKEQIVDELLINLGVRCTHQSYTEKRDILEQHLVELPAKYKLTAEFHDLLDSLLQLELEQKPLTKAMSLPLIEHQTSPIAVWLGDITSLQVDGIVNAANNQMLGCFIPFHRCIDNVIHCAAGPRLRQDCNTIMQLQGEPEATGVAKITRAYNLPSKFVIHTVGPIVKGGLSSDNQADLSKAYLSCLETTKALPQIRSLAFCSISTGVFGFPFKAAAQIAIDAVNAWFKKNPGGLDRVIFNVFKPSEMTIYKNLLDS